MAANFNITTYVKNATRSLGYVAMDTIKDVNPVIADFADTNTDALKEMYNAVKDFKKTARQSKQSIANSEYTKIAKETVGNFLDDLKTGNFYNTERQNRAESSMMSSMGFDLDDDDWDMNFDDTDFDDNSSDDLTASTMDSIGQKIAQASGKAAIQSADYVVRANRATNKALMAQNEVLFGKLYSGLAGVNTTIASIGKSLIPAASTHFENSSKFYDFTSKELTKQTGYLEQIYGLMNARFNPPKQTSSRQRSRYGSAVTSTGMIDIAAYGDIVKENFKQMTDLVTSMASMLNMGGDGGVGMLRSMTASPVSSLMKMGTTFGVNKLFGSDLEKLNRTIGGLFGSAILKLNKNRDKSGLLGIISNLLGIETSSKKAIDTGKYEKGRVDWNGKDEKALREVLPTQLALILSALTGETPKIFNYETGKWTTIRSVQKDLSSRVHNISKSNTRDIREQFGKYFLEEDDVKAKGITKQSKAFHSFDADVSAFFHYLAMNNSKIPMNEKDWNDLEAQMSKMKLFAENSTHGIMLRSNFKRVRSYYKKNKDTGRGYINMEANGALMNARNEIGNFYTREENDPSSMFSMLFNSSGLGGKGNKSKNNFLSNAVDDKGNNVFFYLQKFYSDLARIADNTAYYGRGTSRNMHRRARNGRITYDVPNNNVSDRVANAHRPDELGRSDRFTDINAPDANNEIKEKSESKADKLKDDIEQKLKNNFLTRRFGKVGAFISELLDMPIKGVRSIIDTADNLMYDMIYGRDKSKENPGILQKIMEGFDTTFDTIKKHAKNLFRDHISPFLSAMGDNIAQLFGFKDMKSAFSGIKNSKFVKEVGSSLKGAAKWVGRSIKDTVVDVGDYFTNGSFRGKVDSIIGAVKGFGKSKTEPQAAKGGMVTKTGMVAVSEGEMIIPSNMNPFYNKKTNRLSQKLKEKSIVNKWKAGGSGKTYWGSFADGTTSTGDPNEYGPRMENGNFKSRSEEEKWNQAYNYAYGKIREAVDYGSKQIKGGMDSLGYRLFGDFYDKDGNRKSDDDVKKKTSDVMNRIFGEMKKSAPQMGAGAIIGAGVSAITGLLGGPLIGAAAGAATGLIIKSKYIQNELFGTEDKPGLLGKKVGDFVRNKFPKIAKFSAAGGAIGLTGIIPGGPIAGLMLGAGLSFATESSELRDYLFGKEGIFGQDADKKMIKSLPKALLGAGVLSFTGPFGLLGNMLVGAGIGFASDTDRFKKMIFGTEDSNGNMQGGLVGIIRKDIIDPVSNYVKGGAKKFDSYMKKYIFEPTKNLFKPLNAVIGNTFARMADFIKGEISEKITSPFMKKIDNLLIKPFTRTFGKIFKAGLSVASLPGKAYGTAANFVGNKIKKSQIKRGTAGYMSAEERQLYMEDSRYGLNNARFDTRNYTKSAANMSLADLQAAKDALDAERAMRTGNIKEKKQYKQNIMDRTLADAEWGTTIKNDRNLTKAINEVSKNGGDFTNVYKVIEQLTNQGKIDSEKSGKLTEYIKQQEKGYKAVDQRDNTEIKNSAAEALARLGLNPDDFDDPRIRRLIESDIGHKRSTLSPEAEEEKEKNTEEDRTKNVLSIADNSEKIVKQFNTLNETALSIYRYLNPDANAGGNTDNTTENIITDPARLLPGPVASNKNKNRPDVEQAIADVFKDKSEKDSDSDDNTKVVTTPEGRIIVMRRDSKGNWSRDLRDAETKESMNAIKEEQEQKSKFFATFGMLGGVLGSLKEKLFGKDDDKKEKKSIFETIMDGAKGLFGEGGTVSNLFSNFLGGNGSILSVLMGALPEIATTAGVAILAGLGLKAVKDNPANKEYDPNPLKEGEERTGISEFLKNTKDGVDIIENRLTGHKPGNYEEGEYERANLSDRYLKKGILVNSLIKGQTGNKALTKIPFVGKTIGTALNTPMKYAGKARNFVVDKAEKALKSEGGRAALQGIKKYGSNAISKVADTTAGKTVKKAVTAVADSKAARNAMKDYAVDKAEKSAFKTAFKSFKSSGVENAAQMAAETVGAAAKEAGKDGIFAKIKSLAQSAISKAISLLGGKKAGEAAAKEGAEQLVEAAAEAGTEKVARSFAKSATIVIQLGFIAAAVQNGWEDAKAILGILDEPTLSEKVLAAAINGINEAIPGIGGVIPTELIFSIMFNLLNKFGIIDGAELEQKREDAKAIVADYNATNNETYNVREYIKNVLGEYTTQEKIGRTIGKAGKAVVSGAKKAGSAVVGAGKAVVGGAKKAGSFIAGGAKKAGSFIAGGAKKAGAAVSNISSKIATGAKELISNVKDNVFNVAGWVKEGATALIKLPQDMMKSFLKPESSVNEVMATELDIAEDNPLKGIIQTIGKFAKIPIMPGLYIAALGMGVKRRIIDPLIDKVKATGKSIVDINKTAFGLFKNGDVSGLVKMTPGEAEAEDQTNPIGFVTGAANLVTKIAYFMPTAYSWIGHKIVDGFKAVKNAISTVMPVITSEMENSHRYAQSGDFSGLWNSDPSAQEQDNPLAFVAKAANFASKICYSPMAAFNAVGNKVKEVIDVAKAGLTAIGETIRTEGEASLVSAQAGDISGLWATEVQAEDTSGPLGFIAKAANFASKICYSPMAAFNAVGNKVKEAIETAKAGFTAVATAVGEGYITAKGFSDSHDLSGLMSMDSNPEAEGPMSFVSKVSDFAYKAAFFMPTATGILGDKINELFGKAKSKVLDVKQMVADLWKYTDNSNDIEGYDKTLEGYKSTGTGVDDVINNVITSIVGNVLKIAVKIVRSIRLVGDTVKEGASNVVEGAKNLAETAKDKVVGWVTGSGSGVHVSQRDPSYGSKQFGHSTVAQNGCGPAVAATVLRAYGKNASLKDTVSYAESNGYVAGSSGVGTRASYFSDILGSNGIRSTYTNNQNDIKQYVASGNPTILLGQDKSNTSKSNSPFGPNPHYVVARGTDQRGNVIVDDPELGGTALYKGSILNKAKLGVLTGGASGNVVDGNTNQAKFYQFYTQQGFTPASVIGMMGNVEQESRFKPEMIQGGGKGPAAGLFQWENYNSKSKRWAEMNKHAKSKNKDWSDMTSQMEFALKEMQNESWMWRTPAKNDIFHVKSFDEFKKLDDPIKAMYAFENAFERAGKPAFQNRIDATKKYNEMFTGAKITDATDYGTMSTDGTSTSTSSSESSFGDIGGMINSFLGNAFGKIFSKMGTVGEMFSKVFGFTKEDKSTQGTVGLSSSNSASIGNSGGVVGDKANNFPYYMQSDPKWGSVPYGKSGTISSSGCGPTSMAMVLKSYGQNVTPVDTAAWSQKHGYRVEGSGTSWNYFDAIGKEAGLTTKQFTGIDTAKQFISSGIPVIGSMKPGDFTKGGHFIVFSGLKGNTLNVNDPASKERTGKTWDANAALKQAKQFWAIDKNGAGSIPKTNVGSGSGLIIHDFTKEPNLVGGRSGARYSNMDITRPMNTHAVRTVKTSLEKIGGDSGLSNRDTLKLLQTALEYMKVIADNTAYNANIKSIVEILNSMMTLISGNASTSTTSEATNEDKRDAIEADTQSIIQRLKQLSEAV